ncbi:hypothetical protein GGI02_005960, partial [Coemansia sp. RSA 2322]
MSQPDGTALWPKLLRRVSLTTRPSSSGNNSNSRAGARQQPPPLPIRPTEQLYQPQQLWTDSRPGTVVLSPGLQGLSLYVDEQQRMYEQAQQRPTAAAPDERAPTSERVVEFRLDIPAGVCNMTQHPGDTIVGSVVVTVTKPTQAQRISLVFLGQERVYLRDPGSTALIP